MAQRLAPAQQHQDTGAGAGAGAGAGSGADAGAAQPAPAASLYAKLGLAPMLPAELQDALRQTPASDLNNDDFETVWEPRFRAVGWGSAWATCLLGPHVVRSPGHCFPNSPSLLAAFSFVCHQSSQDQKAAGTGTPAAGTDSHPDMSGPFEAVCNPT